MYKNSTPGILFKKEKKNQNENKICLREWEKLVRLIGTWIWSSYNKKPTLLHGVFAVALFYALMANCWISLVQTMVESGLSKRIITNLLVWSTLFPYYYYFFSLSLYIFRVTHSFIWEYLFLNMIGHIVKQCDCFQQTVIPFSYFVVWHHQLFIF